MASPSVRPAAELSDEERAAVAGIEALRGAGEAAYYRHCQQLCCDAASGLQFNAVRAVVWRDLALGLDAAPPVPSLSQSVIRTGRQQQPGAGDGSPGTPTTTSAEDEEVERVGQLSHSSSGRFTASRKRLSLSSACSQRGGGEREGRGGRSDGSHSPIRRRASSLLVRRRSSETAGAGAGAGPSPDTGSGRQAGVQLPPNCQPRVVAADIQRSLWTLYPEAGEREVMRRQLRDTLLRVLAHNPQRHYYQGLHELVGFIMFVFAPHAPPEVTVSVCEALLRTRWRSFSEERLTHSEALLYAMHAVLAEEDAGLAVALEDCGVAPESHYSVSWVITWFAHCVADTAVLCRLFDYFIAAEDGLNVVFFAAALVLQERERIVEWVVEATGEAEAMGVDAAVMVMAKVYAKLNKLPDELLPAMSAADVGALVRAAQRLRERHLDLVHGEANNFLKGDVKKLGYLANHRTRNAALRLLWVFLPREWRNPAARRQGMGRVALMASIALGAALVIASARWNPTWTDATYY